MTIGMILMTREDLDDKSYQAAFAFVGSADLKYLSRFEWDNACSSRKEINKVASLDIPMMMVMLP